MSKKICANHYGDVEATHLIIARPRVGGKDRRIYLCSGCKAMFELGQLYLPAKIYYLPFYDEDEEDKDGQEINE